MTIVAYQTPLSSHNSASFQLFSHHTAVFRRTFRTRSAILSLRETCLKTKRYQETLKCHDKSARSNSGNRKAVRHRRPRNGARGIYFNDLLGRKGSRHRISELCRKTTEKASPRISLVTTSRQLIHLTPTKTHFLKVALGNMMWERIWLATALELL